MITARLPAMPSPRKSSGTYFCASISGIGGERIFRRAHGHGAAMVAGFREAARRGHTHALQIDADTLVAMGYRDAWSYLDTMRPEGVAKDPACTTMEDPPPGVR